MKTQCDKILIVEDDVGILSTLKQILELEGYNVVTAENGQQAIDVLKTQMKPCLILLDMFMPVMDGWQFLEIVKKRNANGIVDVPIVVTSAAGERAAEAGKLVQGYIKKPFDFDLLLSTITKHCCSKNQPILESHQV